MAEEEAAPHVASTGGEGEGASADAAPAAPAAPTEAELDKQKDDMIKALFPQRKGAGDHKFWDTQPVPKLDENSKRKKDGEEGADEPFGPIDDEKAVSDVRQTPYVLPNGFEWCSINIEDEEELKETYTLLTENYVEDDDGMFRFDYSPEFLRWALMPPGYFKSWIIGIRQSNNKKLRAMVTGVPAHVHVHDKDAKMAEINFLCIHQKLRSKRLAPVLIKEITRRVNLEDQWQAIYTAGVKIPKPIGVAQYFHRSLNPKKLISVGFSRLHPRMTMASTLRLYKVADVPALTIKAMEPRHVKSVQKLLAENQKKYKVWIEMDEAEIAHWLLPRDKVIYSYVIEDPDHPDTVTDFCSFYNLPSSILGNEEYDHLDSAYSFYNVVTTVKLVDLMSDALVFAKKEGFDVFNALNLMENNQFLKQLKFGEGDGRLHYYLYNFAVPEMESKDIGVVLL
mmetsp:Transcript_6214/g.11053  ORF Transcript_6214/g.11053 Transcript_6214/m.11053 type:complete len:452 (-) Transcript_6214:36-1391(-)|eukprot:CAMPEP_0184528196 /NCGR_PEP_ID=MMETSP0198_2-20121128/11657_1 /TAXON_ID=1112570 /ORGANISM="Thraustochytrium sp., Strain LLF1b" /LENGTH=451 /DNA_ID=CAMNT_0026920015 /DNA_START=64 /DNA_END=1419 /DNA_ORIENTATION=+